MDTAFVQIAGIGASLSKEISKRGFDARWFSAAAEAALRETAAFEPPEMSDILAFLSKADAPRQSSFPFSDIPLVVYRDTHFFIELLHWTTSTTCIHEHSFAGAFKVLSGSSLHSPYCFSHVEYIDTDLAIVHGVESRVEHLRPGMVRRIDSGSQGLVHSLYHLESPSVTLVVRTNGSVDQCSLFKPRLWLNELKIMHSDKFNAVARVLGVAAKSSAERGRELLIDAADCLTLSQWVCLLLRNPQLFVDLDQFSGLVARNRHVDGALAVELAYCYQHAVKADVLGAARVAIADPELRFFLALLLNVDDRDYLLSMVAERRPGEDPIRVCAEWLDSIARFRGDPRERLARIAAASSCDFRFGVGLLEALASLTARENWRDVLDAALRAESVADSPTRLIGNVDLRSAVERIRSVPEIRALVGAAS